MEIYYLLFSDISERWLCNSCSWAESLVAVSVQSVTGEVEFLDRRVREVEVQDAELQMLSNLGIKLSTEEGEITTQLHGH